MPEFLSFDLKEPLRMIGTLIIAALIPLSLILMTSFTRISIILTFLRQALGTAVPSGQMIVALSLIFTGYVMHPVLENVYEKSVQPYFETKNEKELMSNGWPILRDFMLKNTREKDLNLFIDLSSEASNLNVEDLPWYCVIPAFVISELRIAFMVGFLLFLPFLIIDMLVTSILMSMGMVMLPPVMISFPFKLLLFIIVDGWHLMTEQLVNSYF